MTERDRTVEDLRIYATEAADLVGEVHDLATEVDPAQLSAWLVELDRIYLLVQGARDAVTVTLRHRPPTPQETSHP